MKKSEVFSGNIIKMCYLEQHIVIDQYQVLFYDTKIFFGCA